MSSTVAVGSPPPAIDSPSASGSATDSLGSAYTVSPLVWDTSDPATATVDSAGLVFPLQAGTVQVILRAGNESGTHALTVVAEIPLQIDTALAEAFQWAFEDTSSANGVIGASEWMTIPVTELAVGLTDRPVTWT